MGSADETSAPKLAGRTEAPRSDLEKATEQSAKEYAKQPRNGKAALAYARNLRALDRKQEALGVLQAAYLFNGQDREYLSEFGRLALENDNAPMAQQLLEQADDPANPDWRVLSARGVALAKQGQYKAAIPFLERARALAPGQSSVASNLALAYTMDGQAAKAEPMLRQATAAQGADPRVRQNLALVLNLQGKSDEATRVAMGNDQPMPAPYRSAAPVSVAATPLPEVQPAAATPARPPVRTAAVRTTAPVAKTEADPDEVIRAAIAAEVAHEQARSRAITTSSVPRQ